MPPGVWIGLYFLVGIFAMSLVILPIFISMGDNRGQVDDAVIVPSVFLTIIWPALLVIAIIVFIIAKAYNHGLLDFYRRLINGHNRR